MSAARIQQLEADAAGAAGLGHFKGTEFHKNSMLAGGAPPSDHKHAGSGAHPFSSLSLEELLHLIPKTPGIFSLSPFPVSGTGSLYFRRMDEPLYPPLGGIF